MRYIKSINVMRFKSKQVFHKMLEKRIEKIRNG